MAREFLLPDPGEGIHEAEIVEVHVAAGDDVKDGDPLFSVETDKAVVDIPSSFDGSIEDVRVAVGDTVEVGSVLLTYTAHDDAGTGEEDAEASAEEPEPAARAEDSDENARTPKRPPVPASPATRSLAKRLDVDLHEIEGSGPDGRIEPQDVQAASEGEPDGEQRSGEDEPARSAMSEEGVEWIDLRGVRRASSRQMTKSWHEIPHVTHHDVADITDLEELRQEHAGSPEADDVGSLSLTVFLMKAAAAALADHPRFNATFDAENERVGLHSRVNIGVAVDTDDGLVVPVIEDAAGKSIAELAMELPSVADRMRRGDRSLEDMEGGTFTITNPGAIGGTSFNPIINHPEVAILGAAAARETPTFPASGEGPEMRLHLPLVVAFDHRVNDGADAARFMNAIKAYLEDPAELLLHI